ncbi:MAG: hypothetical protein WDW38_005679 [Sanguina aurantia]
MQKLQNRAGCRTCSASASRLSSVICQSSKGFGTPKPQHVTGSTGEAPREACLCLSGKSYKRCCEPRHLGVTPPPTPEAALRARYTAYQKNLPEYIVATTSPDYHTFQYQVPAGTATEKLTKDVTAGCTKFDYAGLKIVGTEAGADANEGSVSFEYLSRKRQFVEPGAAAVSAEAADHTSSSGTDRLNGVGSWDRTAEKNRFVRAEGGAWLLADAQTCTMPDISMSQAVASATPIANKTRVKA